MRSSTRANTWHFSSDLSDSLPLILSLAHPPTHPPTRVISPGKKNIISKHVRHKKLHREDLLRKVGGLVHPLHPPRCRRNQTRRFLVTPGDSAARYTVHGTRFGFCCTNNHTVEQNRNRSGGYLRQALQAACLPNKCVCARLKELYK